MEGSMREEIARLAEKFINLEIIALAVLMPLFFLPFTTEFFDFNKLAVLSVGVILGWLAWGLRGALTRRVVTRRTVFDVPILVIWAVTLVSTIFSDSWLLSLIGQYARWLPSLFSATVLALLYFLISWNTKKWASRWFEYGLLISAGIVSIVAWLQYYGVSTLGQTWTDRPTFNPLGSVVTLALFIGSVAGLALREVLTQSRRPNRIFGAVLIVLIPATLAIANSWAGWAALAVSFLTALFSSNVEALRKVKAYLLTSVSLAAVLTAAILVPPLFGKSTFLNREIPEEITLDLQTSWSVAATSFRQNPFTGSGPSTFLSDFTRYKPLRFNQTQFWTLRFEKPISEYLRAFAEEGLLGVLAWLLLIGVTIRTYLKDPGSQFAQIALAVLAGYLLTYATVFSAFLLTGALALSTLGSGSSTPGSSSGGDRRPLAAGIAVAAVALGLSLLVYRAYAAETLHKRSLNSQNGQDIYNLQVRAIQRFPWRADYHLSLARTAFLLANQISTQEDLAQEDQENIKVLVAQSIEEAKRATELFPLNAGNWESLAQVYRSLIGLAKDAETWAVDSYQRAITLDLFNPLLRVSFGGMYYQLGDYERAVEQFRAAVNLKSDYANAHYNLGRAYKEMGSKELAIQSLEAALRLADPEAEGYQEAQEILNELKGQ